MFRHYLTIAWRHLLRQRAFSLINLLGLTVGLTATFLIALWVQDEMKYDRFHANGDRLYRIVSHLNFGGQLESWTTVPLALGKEVAPEMPEIQGMIFHGWEEAALFTHQDQSLQRKGCYASDNLFQHFSYPLLVGQAEAVLDQPHSLVISEDMARELFGLDGVRVAIGKTLAVNHGQAVQITGVMKNFPHHSTLQVDWVRPIDDLVADNPWQLEWGNFNFSGYALLGEGAAPQATQQQINQLVKTKSERDFASFEFQPIGDQYLYGRFEKGQQVGGRISYVRIFGVTAIFLLLIACINFMNLATARASKRAREVGIRKVTGASRSSLVALFYGEAILMAGLALLLAVVVTESVLPAFNALTSKALSLPLGQLSTWGSLLSIALAAGLLAGSYPALLLSSMPILSVLRGGRFALAGGNLNLRRILVVFQFTLSIVLITATMVIYQQISFIQQKNLGLDKDHVLSFALPEFSAERMTRLRQALASQPEVLSLTASDQEPLAIGNSTTSVSWEGKAEDAEPVFHAMRISYDFIKTFRAELLAGRDFDPTVVGDTAGYILNEQSVRAAGFASPEAAIGQPWDLWGNPGQVIGVVKDYHIASMYIPIEPMILMLEPTYLRQVFVRLTPEGTPAGIEAIEQAYQALAPDYPFDYTFVDQKFAQMYASEQVMSQLASLAAGLGIFIACLGLLGLAAFSAEQRTREMSIRKVLGATVPQLLVLMGREFTLLVLLAFVMASLLATWLLHDWLNGFAYHIDPQAWVFALSGVAALLMAWLTIGWQSWRAAHRNPAEALRSE
jgi:ABC-type antimicrobial peptide transport system permease subunit